MSEPIKLKVTDAVSIGSTTIQIGKTETGAPGTEAEVTNSGTATDAVLDFVIPAGVKGDKGDTGAAGAKGEPGPAGAKGDTGAKGDKGDAATVTIGIVTTGAPGTKAAVTNSGTGSDAILNFTIPAGAKGDKGDTGEKGETGATGAKGEPGAKGDTGAKGDAATVTIGTVTTGEPGTKAAVTNSGTSSDVVLNFVIPAGAAGAKGDKGDTGATGAAGAKGDKGDTGATGADGKTPVRGTDYWTEDDINTIKAYCENAVLNGEW